MAGCGWVGFLLLLFLCQITAANKHGSLPTNIHMPKHKSDLKKRPKPKNLKSRKRSRQHYYEQGPSFSERFFAKGLEAAQKTAALASIATREASKHGFVFASAAARIARSKTSSPLETLLLQATRPSETPVMASDMKLILREIRSSSSHPKGTNPYDKTLHKIWKKIVDPDWRTSFKAVGILHRIARGAKPRERFQFAKRSRMLQRCVRDKSSKQKLLEFKYFDKRAITCKDSQAKFVKLYLDFVMLRLSHLSGNLNEISLDNFDSSNTIPLAQQVLEAALQVNVNKNMEAGIVVCDCCYLVGRDVESVWDRLSIVLEHVINTKSHDDRALQLAQWWLDTQSRVSEWHAAYSKTMSKIKFKVHPINTEAHISSDLVSRFVENVHPK